MIAQELIEEIKSSWTKRELRERRILSFIGLITLVSIVYLVGVEPALRNRSNLEKSIPQLKQNAAKMTDLAAQYSALSKTLSEGVAPISRELIESTLARRNIKTQSLSVSNEIVRFQVNVVAYSNMMEWLLEMQRVARLTVEEIKVTSLTEPGQVSVVVTLKQQRA
ncbi:type II secretion system protein M [Undibacterium sp. LX40W]|uniref:Type II secretion system protein M n=1 Tax=Undibacterium nitidum TaxID=2762298 RepID=A0A923KMQ4_9BURK|nr:MULTISPECIES: type II secretion system protein GspM [Undibacterium]MBC3879768.1 type II secretion system protein M [Undibacterium nitidum]MBC3891496.1 type II secretion system protein M [Undibacterium sp. LX40W]